jgi:phage shock protein A
MPAKKKCKSRSVDDTHERDLENKKWNKDAEAALVSNIGKDLPKNPNDDTEDQSEAREFLEEYKSSKQAVANNRLMETEVKKTEQALRKGMRSFQGSYCNRKRRCVLQL